MPTRRRFLILLSVLPFSLAHERAKAERASGAISEPTEPVDINHATLDELMKVPGMTRSWAGRIIRFRPYRMKSDLVERGVVTSEVYARIKDSIIAHRDPK